MFCPATAIDEICHELTTGQKTGFFPLVFAVVRYRCKATISADRQPRTTGLEIPAGKQIRFIRPPLQRLRRALIKLITISGKDQAVIRMDLPCKNDEAHSLIFSRSRASLQPGDALSKVGTAALEILSDILSW